jgi:hypothetical protein
MGLITNLKAAAAAGAKGYNAAKVTASKVAAEIAKKKETAKLAEEAAIKAAKKAKELDTAKKGAAAYKNVKVAVGAGTVGAVGGAYAMNKYNNASAAAAKAKAEKQASTKKAINKMLPSNLSKALDLKKKGGATKSFPDLNKDGKITKADILIGKKVIPKAKKGGATDSKWIQKAVNPAHKGFCTPMSKPTCTPKRKALARTFKAMAKNK